MKWLKPTKVSGRGMTLIEIMVVLTILATIAAAVAVNVIRQIDKARQDVALSDIRAIEGALKLHYARHGRFPDPAKGLKGLDLVRTKDPWKREYVYILESGKPVIISYGRDGAPGGEGADTDISSRDADQSGEETK